MQVNELKFKLAIARLLTFNLIPEFGNDLLYAWKRHFTLTFLLRSQASTSCDGPISY